VEGPTDAELAQLTEKIREHRRKSRMAKLAGVAAALVFTLAGCGAAFIDARMFFFALVLGAIVGAVIWNYLEPKHDPVDD
jgi:hypothetical protein